MARPLALAVLAGLALTALTGCRDATDLLPHERGGTAAGPRALALAWSTPATEPAWLPADASRIRWIAATRGGADRAPAALLVRSAAALPGSCTAAERLPAAAIRAPWAPPTPTGPPRRCGNWAVVPVDGGYAAWTPAAPDDAT